MADSDSTSTENAFYSSYQLTDLLFKGFTVTSLPGFLGVLVGIVSVSILYEGLRQVKDFFFNRFADTRKQSILFQQQQQQQPSNVVIQRNKHGRRSRNRSSDSSGSTKRCDSIRYFNINKKSPVDDPDFDTPIGPGGDAGPSRPRPACPATSSSLVFSGDGDREGSPACPAQEPGPSTALMPQSTIANVRVRVEDLIIATLLHMLYITIGYMLMLAVMTFNVWILIAVTIGVALGYLVFGTFRRLDHLATYKRITVMECCEDGGGDEDSSNRMLVGVGGQGRGARGDSVGPEGPLLGSGSDSRSSSQTNDSTVGSGYGTTTTPVVLCTGQEPDENQALMTEKRKGRH